MTSYLTINPGGVEYIKWTATGLPTDPAPTAVEVSIDKGLTWHPATVIGAEITVLVAHPTATSPDPAAIVATAGYREMLVRVTDTPEVVIRPGGRLDTPWAGGGVTWGPGTIAPAADWAAAIDALNGA